MNVSTLNSLSLFFCLINYVERWNRVIADEESDKFILITTTKTWSNAKSYCSSNFGTGLATITSEEDNTEIYDLTVAADLKEQAWLGGSDSDTEGTWVWDDGTGNIDNLYSNWAPGEPNNSGGQDCMKMYLIETDNPGKWDDTDCSKTHRFVCNYPHYRFIPKELSYDKGNNYCKNGYNSTLGIIGGKDANSEAYSIARNGLTKVLNTSGSDNSGDYYVWFGIEFDSSFNGTEEIITYTYNDTNCSISNVSSYSNGTESELDTDCYYITYKLVSTNGTWVGSDGRQLYWTRWSNDSSNIHDFATTALCGLFKFSWDFDNQGFVNESSRWYIEECDTRETYFICDGFSSDDTLIPTGVPTYQPSEIPTINPTR